MKNGIRRGAHLALALGLCLALGGWSFGVREGNIILGGAIDYITSSLTSPLASAGWVIANASYCPHPVTGTLNPNSATVTNINTTGISVGDLISDNTAGGNGYIQYGTTVTAVNAGANKITLSNPVSSTTPPNTVLSLLDEPLYPVAQADWDPTDPTIVDQPQNALAVGGGTATATTTTGVADGSPAITGVNNVFGATAGWWVTTADLNAPVQIASISGSAPNYSITLVNGANAQINYTAQTTITLQPNEPTIVQYRNSAEGTAAAASFTGYIDNDGGGAAGLVLHVTALTSGSIALYVPLYAPGGGLAQGTYITGCPAGGCGGVGDYTVSDLQLLGSSGAPASLEAMGTVATYHSFSGYTNSPGAFPRSPTTVTYAPGDVYEVLPAIYAGFNQALDLEPNTDGWCGNEVVTAGSDYVTCTSHAGNFTVGDFLTEYGVGVATHYVGYISGTTFTVTMVDGGLNGVDNASVGEIVTGGGIASGTMITACGASGCLAPGTFTVGCMSGASGGCASQTLGSASAPVAFTVEGNFGTDETSTVTAVYPSGNANCPAPNTDLCIQVSRTPVVTKASGEGWSTYLTKPVSTLTVEGVTQTLGGNPTRPEIAEDSSPTGGSGTLKAMVNIGNDAGTGTTSGLLLRNIDVESNGLANEEYLVDIHTGLIGTNTLEQMRIEGQLWGTKLANASSNTGDGIISGEDLNIISNQFDPPDTIDQILDNQGTLNLDQLILADNGGSQGPQHDVYIGNTPRLTVNFINSWSTRANFGHLIKSRAGVTNIIGSYLEGDDTLSGLTGVAFQGYLANGILNVTSVSKGTILPEVTLSAAGLDAGTSIGSFVAGSGTPGGVGQYNLVCASPFNWGACSGQANIGSPGSPIAFTSDYFNDGDADGTAPAESRDAEITCAGTATIENTILTKGEAGPQSNQDFIAYGEEMESHHYNATVSTGTAIGGSTLNLNSTGPIAYQFAADATNPWAFPWGTQITATTATSVTLATEPGTNCGGAVCMPVQPGDTILLFYSCPFTDATNKLTVKNNDLIAYRPAWDGVQNHQPFTIYSTVGYDKWVLPGDTGWPFASNSDWTITDNIIAGVCSSATSVVDAKDTNSTNSGLAYADFPWTGPAPSGGLNGALSLVLSPAELNARFRQSGTVYGDSSDTAILGTTAYLHAAAAGLTRALAVIGAED